MIASMIDVWRKAPGEVRADVVDLFLATPTILIAMFIVWVATP